MLPKKCSSRASKDSRATASNANRSSRATSRAYPSNPSNPRNRTGMESRHDYYPSDVYDVDSDGNPVYEMEYDSEGNEKALIPKFR